MNRSVPAPLIVAAAALIALSTFAALNDIRPALLFASVIAAAQPLLLAATGELVAEKSGVLNLGVEGMMIVGAIAGFAIAVNTGSPIVGVGAAALAGAALAMIFGILTQVFLTNQVATGLALTLFGLGLAALLGQGYTGQKPPAFPRLDIPFLSDAPVIGPLIFAHDLMVYIALALVALVWAFLTYTRAGLTLRAIGEDHDAAHALGYRVVRMRLLAIAFGGAMAGLGGAYLSLIRVPLWSEGMTAGIGWIALAIVVFGTWRPWRVMLGAYLFGGVTILQLNMQAENITPLWLIVFGLFLFATHYTVADIQRRQRLRRPAVVLWIATLVVAVQAETNPISVSSEYLSMTPYIATIIVLVVISSNRMQTNLQAPASLGRIFQARD